MLQEFQFHKGTIKTLHQPSSTEFANIFQFHKGTIKTIAQRDIPLLQRNFNSIKVRLKRYYQSIRRCGRLISIP